MVEHILVNRASKVLFENIVFKCLGSVSGQERNTYSSSRRGED